MAAVSISCDARPKLSFRARVQTDKVSGKPVLLYPEGALILNNTGHAIVELCNGALTVNEMLSRLAERFHAPIDSIGPEVLRYLEKLRARNLIELAQPSVAS